MSERLGLLAGVLGAIGVDMAQAYTRPEAFVAGLHATMLRALPALYRTDLAKTEDRNAPTAPARTSCSASWPTWRCSRPTS